MELRPAYRDWLNAAGWEVRAQHPDKVSGSCTLATLKRSGVDGIFAEVLGGFNAVPCDDNHSKASCPSITLSLIQGSCPWRGRVRK